MTEHNLNRRSSRSHVIYSFYITATRNINASSPTKKKSNQSSSSQDVVESKLHLVDLAGSERVEKTGSVGKISWLCLSSSSFYFIILICMIFISKGEFKKKPIISIRVYPF